MDCRLQGRVRTMAEQLAREHQQELAAAGRLMDLEELTCEVGDELTRLLTEQELTRRGQQDAQQPADCPDCGQVCVPMPDPEPVLLQGLRGELAYSQPRHYCDRCRRSFFPSGRSARTTGTKHRHDQGSAEGRLGGGE
jgi:hypothetical protein